MRDTFDRHIPSSGGAEGTTAEILWTLAMLGVVLLVIAVFVPPDKTSSRDFRNKFFDPTRYQAEHP